MSDVVTNADGTPRLINCKLYIPAVGKTVSMDLPSRVALEDIRPSISKFLNAPLFAKKLIFHYLNAKKDLLPLEADKPLCEQTEIIDFKRTPAEIEIKIEHAGACQTEAKSGDIGVTSISDFSILELFCNGPNLAYFLHVFIMLALLNFAMNIL